MEEQRSIDIAIDDLKDQIKNHRDAARKILFYVMYIVSLLLVFGAAIFVYQDYRTTEFSGSIGGIGGGVYISSSADTKGKQSAPAATTDPNMLSPADVNRNQSASTPAPTTDTSMSSASGGSFGVSSGFYAPNTTVLYVFVVLFVVVFGVMMAIYRFHLNEISRSEQLKVGFMRIRIAANNHDKEGFLSEVRGALTNDAFTYQTGKEKKVESPLPGHPSSDISALLVNKLIDSIDLKIKDKN
ncbi:MULTISPECIES: hypothetical protein [unclassified Neptuniibacter]|uniref:hypothetical protein n=1 Tax=unclassified Neptuniibacter TaxID=2630693 RepID=UPI000C3D2D0F|nr:MULTISPECIES: hypothetical protein [unclassified Neptuniibacter]MAY43231.1 hypothetical protein [Oceanospirillaceae bacterium]|tara:strand:+ start:23715 stop:24440 length:726 start_codon:yes stop_codon:yes gene_type:complete